MSAARRQKRKRKMMMNGTCTEAVYSNPAAKEADITNEHVEMVEMCKSIEIEAFHNR